MTGDTTMTHNTLSLLTRALTCVDLATTDPFFKPDSTRKLAEEIRAHIAEETSKKVKPSHFTRINNDVNGNPRYVCHYTHLSTPVDRDADISERYALALARACSIGGRKFHNKQYGGGVVFQTYSLPDTCDSINKITGA
jgi:hypothetical protein